MHWVEQYAQSGFADRVGIEHAEYIVEELVEGILYVGYLPCRDRFIEFKRFYLGQIRDYFFELCGRLGGSVASLFDNQLDSIIFGRVMAGSDFHSVVESELHYGVHDKRRGRAAIQKQHLYVVGRERSGNPLRRRV